MKAETMRGACPWEPQRLLLAVCYWASYIIINLYFITGKIRVSLLKTYLESDTMDAQL